MAIRTVVTRGYGNGTFNGTIALAVTRGYAIGAGGAPIVTPDHRIMGMAAQTRTLAVQSDDRTLAVGSQDRTMGIEE